MAEMWKPLTINEYKEWITKIWAEAPELLNDWEKRFLHSLTRQLYHATNLNENQANKLEQIYAKYTK